MDVVEASFSPLRKILICLNSTNVIAMSIVIISTLFQLMFLIVPKYLENMFFWEYLGLFHRFHENFMRIREDGHFQNCSRKGRQLGKYCYVAVVRIFLRKCDQF